MDDPRIEAKDLAQARGEYEVADEMETADCLQMASDELRQRLAEQEFRELHWRAGGAKGMATRPALIGDPTARSGSGEYLGFSMLPFVAYSSHGEHFPTYSEKQISRGKIAAAFRRAWVAEPATPARHLLN